jgi:hypothetical protein
MNFLTILVQNFFPRHDTKLTPDGAQLNGTLFHAGRSFVWKHYAEFWAPDRKKDSRYFFLLVRTMNSLVVLDMDISVK